MLHRVRQTIIKHNLLAKGDRIVVGVSGGADSSALLHMLKVLSDEFNWKLHVAHIEHGLRAEESLADAEYVKQLAEQLDLPFHLAQPPVKKYAREKGLGTQVAARELRYEALEHIARNVHATKIALAHHADDQAETILLRVLRGTSISGLSGIPRKREWRGVEIVRPLMQVYRHEIEEYCLNNGITYRTDSSNESVAYTRNKVRLQLLPLLQKEYNKNIKHSLIRLGQIASDEDEWMDQQARELSAQIIMSSDGAQIVVDVHRLLAIHIALQRRVITLILYYLCGDTKEWEGRHMEAVLQLAVNQNPSAQISLPNGLIAYKEYHLLHIAKQLHLPEPDYVSATIALNIPDLGKVPAVPEEFDLSEFGFNGTMELLEGAVFPVDEWEAVFDYAKVAGRSFIVRSRQAGDSMQPFGMQGTRKLKDIFIDARVPKGKRDNWPIWTMEGQIVWVPGIRRSKAASVSPNTRNTLLIRVTRYK